MKESFGEDFLKKKYDLHKAPEVEEQAERTEHRTGEKVPQSPASRIHNYLGRFEEILGREDAEDQERGIEALKRILHREAVIRPEDVPEAYFELQRRIARDRGHGDVEVTPEMRQQLVEALVTDQKSSLDAWVDYFASPDALYPTWLKYWATREVLKMGEYDKAKKAFTKRSKGTVKPFPDLDREALAYVLDAVGKKYAPPEEEPVAGPLTRDQAEFQELLRGENFPKLYAWAIEKVTSASKESLENVEGEWLTYPKGSDHMPLVESLQGHGTGWCTAGESTAKTQLALGDFHVYYSKDGHGQNTIPRVAIRMEDDKIAEVRGIAAEQNLDPYIGGVVKEKMAEFPDGAAYEKKASDMKRLTELERKVNDGHELDRDDLRFLYELDSRIEGFGYEEDPRVVELRERRLNKRKDLSIATGYAPEEISLTPMEAESGRARFHYGDLDFRHLAIAKGKVLPESVSGGIYLGDLENAEGLILPRSVGKYLNLSRLGSAKGLRLPESVGGELNLGRLESAEGLWLPESVGGLKLSGLTSTEDLWLPESVDGVLDLGGLTSAEGLKLPESINGELMLNGLTSAEGLVLPKSVQSLSLRGITSAEGLKLPESVSSGIDLIGLTSAEGLIFPREVRNLNLGGLTSAEGLKLPESVSGILNLSGLTSAEGLNLPRAVEVLDLRGLTNAKGLTLPETVKVLNLGGLTSAEGLRLPETMELLSLGGLTSAEGLRLPKSVTEDLDLRGLKSAKGLMLPESVGGNLILHGLTSAEGFVPPRHVGGRIDSPIKLPDSLSS